MEHSFEKIKNGTAAEKLLGLDMVFALASLPVHLTSMNDHDLDILASVVNDTKQYLSVRNKAALVCWMLENVLHGRFGMSLVKRGVHLKAIQTLREAATSAQEESQLLSMMPETFLFYPSHAEDEALNGEHGRL